MIFLYHMLWTGICFPCLFGVAALKKGRLARRLIPKPPERELPSGNIWVHALSVGEVISALPLVDQLKCRYPDTGIVFTSTTTQGFDLARHELNGKVVALLPMPFDFWWSVHRTVDYIKPAVFVLVETDIWPGLIHYLASKKIKSLLVNGRISRSTFASYKKFPLVAKALFKDLDMCLMQSSLDTQRLIEVGVSPEKVLTAGNIKFDRQWNPMGREEKENWLALFGFKEDHIIWVAGSTHGEESEIILRTFLNLRPSHPLLRLIIAPRKIEEAGSLKEKGVAMGLNVALRTALGQNGAPEVVILDTIGELGRVYGLAKISFVGGSLVQKGGHNLLEPASFGSLVLFGPHTENFVAMSNDLIEAGGGIRVQNEEELLATMKQLLDTPQTIDEKGNLAIKFVYSNQGALNTVMEYIAKCISCGEATA